MRLNWYRGFIRVWLVLSLLWIVFWAAVGIGVAYQQDEFEKRVATARAFDPEAAKHGGLLFTSDGSVCKGDWFARNAPDCTVNPSGPHSPAEVGAPWLVMVTVPAMFYGMLRAAAWILRGFGRQA